MKLDSDGMANNSREAEVALSCARACLQSSNYGRAFDSFFRFLKLKPEECKAVYHEFGLVTRKWCETLEQGDRLEELFHCFKQACEAYRDHDTILNNIGAQLFRLGYVEEAAAYIRRSLIVNPGYLAARHNLENVCSHLVERWHFTMLNDKRRNVAYKFAIDKAIKLGYDTVLDIGTGTGLLSLMCEFSGARHVTACDRSRAMIEVARDVLQDNLAQDSIHLVHKSSTDMKVPDDLPKRVRLVVTETFDAGLFGENIVSTLTHAWGNLISTSPMGTVIPCGATMYVCGIECDAIRAQNRMLYPVLQHLDLSMVDIHCTTGQQPDDPYTTENLAAVRGGYKILTNIAELLRVNFCNLCELESLQKGKEWQSSLFVKQHGRLDALAVWFDLHLDDTVTIATGADSESCWEQAIYPITSVCRRSSGENGRHESCHLKKKEKLSVLFRFQDNCLRLHQCEVLIPGLYRPSQKGTTPSGPSIPDSSGKSIKNCSTSNLPFRKRKVETDSSVSNTVVRDAEPSQLIDSESSADTNCEFKVSKCLNIHKDISERNIEPSSLKETVDDTCSCINSEQGISPSQKKESDHVKTLKCAAERVVLASERCLYGTTKSGGNIEDDQCFDTLHLETNLKLNLNLGYNCTDVSKESPLKHGTTNDSKDSARQQVLGSNYQGCAATFLIEREDVGCLNDIQLNKAYCQALEAHKSQKSNQQLSCLIITSQLSFLAIQAAKMGYKPVAMITREENHGTIRRVAVLNGCQAGGITLLDLMDLGDIELKADVIVFDVVEPVGVMRQQVIEDMVLQKFQNLSPDGLLLPGKVTIHGMFIESERLEGQSRVISNVKTLGLQIAQHINVFQMQNHANIDLSMLPHRKLSEVFTVFEVNLMTLNPSDWFRIHQQTVEKSVEIINSGQMTALVYWFELSLSADCVVSTLDARCHWKQAAVMMKGDQSAVAGQMVQAQITMQSSCLDVTLNIPGPLNGVYHATTNGSIH